MSDLSRHFSKISRLAPKSSWVVLGALLLALVFSKVFGIWEVSRLDRSALEPLSQWREQAFHQIEESVDDVFRELHQSSLALASSFEVIDGFRSRQGLRGTNEKIVSLSAGIELNDRAFLEIYDQHPTLLGWSGPAFPMDSGVSDPEFLVRAVDRVARDGARRTALVVWQPIFDEGRVIGTIRMGQIVESIVPIKNDYLRDYSWNEEWTKRLKTSAVFEFGDRITIKNDSERTIKSPFGDVLGKVTLVSPSIESLKKEKSQKYDDVVIFWAFLIMMWILIVSSLGIWNYYRNRALQDDPHDDPLKMRFLGFYLAWLVFVRWTFLFFDIPSRWQLGKSPLAPLFDPQHLASEFGFGALRNIGDLFISAIFLTMASLVILRATSWMRLQKVATLHFDNRATFRARTIVFVCIHVGIAALISAFLFELSSHTILDSTLDYFARSGLLPERMILVVFGALLLVVFASVLVGGRSLWMLLFLGKEDVSLLPSPAKVVGLYGLAGVLIGWFTVWMEWGAPIEVFGVILVAIMVSARANPVQATRRSPVVALRHIVPLVMVTSILLFPMLEISADHKTQNRMKDAAQSFLEDQDSRIMFAVSQVLTTASTEGFLSAFNSINQTADAEARSRTDSLAEESTRGFLLSAMVGYDVTVTIHSLDGTVLGRYSSLIRRASRSTRDQADKADFELFSAMYKDFGGDGPMIEKLTGTTDQNRFRYTGFLNDPSKEEFYMLVRAEQRIVAESAGSPFPKVLSPAGYYGNRFADLSVAEFKDGVLIRSQGRNFGRSFLDEDVRERLLSNPEVWIKESIRDRSYETYYRTEESLDSGSNSSVIAIRKRTTNFFDQLYHLLRVVVAGMFLAAPFYLGGVFWRLRKKRLPDEPRHFRDRVLNAFFSVGIVTVFAMGFVGLGVVTGENDRAIESWLRQHLERVEETLQLETNGEEMPYRVLERMSVDSLSARVGLDLVVFRGVEVDQASRPELIKDRLIERRLPIEAYSALFFEGYRFVTVDENLGLFEYTAGYRTLTDESGLPRYVLSIPTLPEQERIEEERARTVAYLFGSLLLLVLVVMVTASLLANALTRPIAQLRAGLQSVAAGHFERIAKIESGDEIAGLVDSFNTMQDQLEESQRLIGQQERQLAWKEMARQVAHEIKNPLTPMKLSIQHLRSAYSRRSEDGTDDAKFSNKFDQTTTTLIEQINALARIANEFSSFGRMPTHIREEVDLNVVIQEAVELMQAEDNVDISTELGTSRFIVQADREALRRVYINFLKNAIQAVPEGRLAEILITSNAVLEGDQWYAVSKVIDNGAGIPRNLWEKIFVPSFSTKTSGTGLGLAIARKTVENMDGEIGFDTRFEKGSTFWIKVPMNTSGN
jgi:two-component system, NtrC family, nitrogen regulation sensor histidine kinase NtrY